MKKMFLILSVAGLFTACKKDKTPGAEPTAITKLKTTTITSPTGSAGIYNYEYDTQNRLIKTLLGTGPRRIEYIYSTGSLKENNYNSSGVLTESKTHDLNNEGLVVKTIFSSSPGYYFTTTYNSSQQLLKQMEYNSGGTLATVSNFYYTNQLLDSVVYRNSTNMTIGKKTYSYYANIINTTGAQNAGRTAFGKESTKAISKIHSYYYDYTTGAQVDHTLDTYSYETDTEARIIKTTLSSSNTLGSIIYTYTYY